MAEITPTENGPIWIRGDFKIVLSDGTELDVEDDAWLCRCGQSETKPFCDGSHKGQQFASANGEMRDQSG